jgi:hypothetical protein
LILLRLWLMWGGHTRSLWVSTLLLLQQKLPLLHFLQ